MKQPNFFRRMWNRFTKRTSLSDPRIFNILTFGKGSNKNPVYEDEALQATACWRALNLLGSGVAMMDKYVNSRQGDKWLRNDSHNITQLLNYPSRFYSGFNFFETMTAFAALYSNAYAAILRTADYTPVELIMIHPMMCTPEVINGEKWYRAIIGQRSYVIHDMDMIHICRLMLDVEEFKGKSTLNLHRNIYRLINESVDYPVEFYENGGHIPGYLWTDQFLEDDDVEEIQTRWQGSTTAGVGNTPVLHGGLQYQQLKLTPKDALFIETAKLGDAEIAKMFDIPIHMLSAMERTTFNNIEHQSHEYLNYTLGSWNQRWVAELSRKLLSRRERLFQRVIFDKKPLQIANLQSMGEFLSRMVQAGILSRNDARGELGYNPTDEDLLLSPANLISDEERNTRDSGSALSTSSVSEQQQLQTTTQE